MFYLTFCENFKGLLSFWRGNLVNVLRYFPTPALTVFVNGQVKNRFQGTVYFDYIQDASFATKFAAEIACGGFAGSLTLTCFYSLDFARTKLANDAKGKGGTRQYNGLIDVYRKTLASDGIRGLYRGFVISCVGE